MLNQESKIIGEKCLAQLDELLVILKRARRESFLCMDYIELIFIPLTNRDLKKAKKLADEIRISLEALKTSLGEEGKFLPRLLDPHGRTEAIEYFLGLTWDTSSEKIKEYLKATNNARSALMNLLDYS